VYSIQVGEDSSIAGGGEVSALDQLEASPPHAVGLANYKTRRCGEERNNMSRDERYFIPFAQK